MDFAYIQKTSLIDYPENICSTIFTIGCNFKCPFCYNRTLVIPEEYPKNPLSNEQVLSTLFKRTHFVHAVCITGGEPTVFDDLYDFIKSLKKEGFLVKLDTNGTNPKMIKRLIDDKLLDYVAVDIKNSQIKYAKTIGLESFDASKIKETVDLLRQNNISFELRTTIVPTVHNIESIEEIGKWVGGGKFVIQDFRRTNSLIDPSLMNVIPFSQNELETFKKTAEKYFDKVELRI
ncbi:MAG: anaerobic ribonucleoside-triphosphate reductase activating protein [Candidatus Micrarchaeia archaeon]|jgi:pyruvate formate lyase activating enzyme